MEIQWNEKYEPQPDLLITRCSESLLQIRARLMTRSKSDGIHPKCRGESERRHPGEARLTQVAKPTPITGCLLRAPAPSIPALPSVADVSVDLSAACSRTGQLESARLYSSSTTPGQAPLSQADFTQGPEPARYSRRDEEDGLVLASLKQAGRPPGLPVHISRR